VNSVIVFVAMCASAAFGTFVHRRLPQRHRSPESLDIVRFAITLLLTFTAIVLGLLTTSVKSGFDAAYDARSADAAQLVQLDRCLRDYGAETTFIRNQLQGYVATVIASTWPDEPRPVGLNYPDPSGMPKIGESPLLSTLLSSVGHEIRALQPANALQRTVAADCDAQYHSVIEARWKVIEGARPSISPPFYWVLVTWLAILFAAFGLTARPNAMVVTVTVLCAFSIALAVFVLLDLDEPYGGLFGIPSNAMRHALDDMRAASRPPARGPLAVTARLMAPIRSNETVRISNMASSHAVSTYAHFVWPQA